MELVHDDLADIRGGAVAQRDVRQDLRGAADDRRPTVHTGVAGHHPDLVGAKDLAQVEELLGDKRLDRNGVKTSPFGGESGEVSANGDVSMTVDGEEIQLTLPSLETYDGDNGDEEGFFPASHKWLGFLPEGRLRLADAGWHRIEQFFAEMPIDVPDVARSRLEIILGRQLYDTALRELGVMLESRMREHVGSTAFGAKLVDEFVENLTESGSYLNSYVKVLRISLRTAFKFIRNEFAHNLVDLPKSRAAVLIGQMSALLEDVSELVDGGQAGEPG